MKELSKDEFLGGSSTGIDVIALLNNANTAYTGSLLFGTPLQGSTFSSQFYYDTSSSYTTVTTT